MSKAKELAEKYFNGLKEAYKKSDYSAYETLTKITSGAAEEDIIKLEAVYPDVPEELTELLRLVDGTYHKEYPKGSAAEYMLATDLGDGEESAWYPYYLLSAEEIVHNRHEADFYADFIDGKYIEVDIDSRLTDNSENMKWLHFADCMNNGGTSQLFIDFSPSESGKKGQIVRFLHDPDEITVIADSLGALLEQIIDSGYAFTADDDDYE